jgi:arsenate reductase
MEKEKVLFICTHNSARSQMAEGLLRSLRGDRYEVYSAGSDPAGVSTHAVKAMAEISIDISNHRSKNIREFSGMAFNYVVTVCDHVREVCPVYTGAKRTIHKDFNDPSALTGPEENIMAGFRDVRDKIRNWIERDFLEYPKDA